jgi:4-amino-4-deoxy-L-arabinose transferase-like glycosyltransferase
MLYSVLSRFALSAGLSDGWAMRLPAVLFGVASIVAVVWFGIRVTTRHEAWAAAAILTASYHHVWFSQNARGYTGLLFLTIVGSGCFLALLARPGQHTRRWVAAYAVTMALAHLVHITAAFVTAAHGLIWLALAVSQRRSLRDRAWLTPLTALALTATLTFLLYALVLPQLVGTLMAPTDGGSAGMWKSPWWLVTETLRVLGNGVPGGLVSVGIALGVVLFGVVSYVKQSRALGAVMLLPLVCTAVILLATTHNLWPRFFFFGAAFIVLIALRGGFAIARQLLPRHGLTLATVAAFGVAVLSAFTVPRAWGPKQDYAGALAFVDAKSIPTDGFAGVDMTGLVYTRYYQRPWANLTSADELTRLEASHARTWVVVTFPSRLSVIQPAMWDHLTRSYRTIATFPGTVGGGAIMVLVNR